MKHPPPFDPWMEGNENKLSKLKNKEICIGYTALGCLQQLKKREFEGSFKSLLKQERDDYIAKLSVINESI